MREVFEALADRHLGPKATEGHPLSRLRGPVASARMVRVATSLNSPTGSHAMIVHDGSPNYHRTLMALYDDRERGARPKPAGLHVEIALTLTEIHQSAGVEPEEAADAEVEIRNLFEALKVSPQPIHIGCLSLEVKRVSHSPDGLVLYGVAEPRVENKTRRESV